MAKQLDYVAELILDCLRQTVGSEAYVSEKRRELQNEDRLGALRYASYLDEQNKALLAQKLDVSPDDLAATLRVIKRL